MDIKHFLHQVYELELLERRRFLTIVPADLISGVMYEGLIATNLRLPSYASGPQLMNVVLGYTAYDYQPTAVPNPDGTYNLYTKILPGSAGSIPIVIDFRNDRTGRWDTLESGDLVVKENHFNPVFSYFSINNQKSGVLFNQVLATFRTSSLTQSLDNYEVSVDWFGNPQTGRLELQADGLVAVYLNNSYVPVNGGGETTITIRLKNASPDTPVAGAAVVELRANGTGPGLAIGTFDGLMTSDTDFEVRLPKTLKISGSDYNHFIPVTETSGWFSTFTVNVLWQERNSSNLIQTTETITRNEDGTYSVSGKWPENIGADGGQIKIYETVHRPAIGGEPAQTYTMCYVGSISVIGHPWSFPPEESTPDNPHVSVNPDYPNDTSGIITIVDVISPPDIITYRDNPLSPVPGEVINRINLPILNDLTDQNAPASSTDTIATGILRNQDDDLLFGDDVESVQLQELA